MTNPTPHPPSTASHIPRATDLHNPYPRQMRFSALAFLFLAIITTAFVLVSQTTSPLASKFLQLIAAFFGIATIGSALVIPIMWLEARETDRTFDSIRDGHFYVRWEYPRDFWQAWINWQIAHAGNMLGMTTIVLLAAIPVILLAMHWYADANHLNNSARQAQGAVLVPIVFFAGVFSVCWFRARLKRNAPLTNPPYIAYISKTAVYLHGNVDLLVTGLGKLISIKIITTDFPRIEFRFIQSIRNGYHQFTRLLPIPPGQMAIAERLVATLRREYFGPAK